MKKLICLMGAVIMAVSLFLFPCSAYSSTTPVYSVSLMSSFYFTSPRYQEYVSHVLTTDSSQLGSTSIVGGPFANIYSSLIGYPSHLTITLQEPTSNIGSVLVQGTWGFYAVNTDETSLHRVLENGVGAMLVTYSDGTTEYINLVNGENFYITKNSATDSAGIVFYASFNTSKGKYLQQVDFNLVSEDVSNKLYFGIDRRWESAPSYIQIDYTNFMITFETGTGGGGTTDPDDPDDPDYPGTGGGSGGDGTTSQDVLDAIITLDQSIKGQTTAISNAITSLGDTLAHVDAETAEKLLETETKRLQLEEDLSSVEDITDEYFNDLVNRFQLLGLEDWEWPASVISAFALLGGVFTQIWDSFGAYKVVYLFPMVLSIILVIVGRIARHGRRTGSGATNNNDRQGEVKDA